MFNISENIQETDKPSATYNNKMRRRKKIIILISVVSVILILLLIVLLILLITYLQADSSDQVDLTKPWLHYRLPDAIKPIHYDITYHPKFYTSEEGSFQGNETISLEVGANISTSYILINARNLTITKTRLFNNKEEEMKLKRTFAHVELDYWVIETEEPLVQNSSLELFLQFSGSLLHNMEAAYKGYFTEPISNTTVFIMSSKFEPAYARMAFPGFDEPRFKAYYTMHMIHKESHTALFNTPKERQTTLPNGWEITHFERTPVVMSTYLVAWAVITNYSSVDDNDVPGRQMRYFAPTYRKEDLDWARSVGRKVRNYLDKFTDFESPLKKVDMITIPQFKAGAMENWGLIAYREGLLLFNPTKDVDTNKYHICRVIAHELAHTWFGNIVTMDWWGDLWLNEAFATHIAALAVYNVEPAWKTFEYTILSNRAGVIRTETEKQSLPILGNVTTRQGMRKMFNSYVYRKGGQLLYWVQRFMGTDMFQRGLQRYLKKYQYKVAVTDNLLEALDNEAFHLSINISDLMRPWLTQRGYPIVTVTSEENGSVFYLNQTSNLKSSSDLWNIPLWQVTTAEGTFNLTDNKYPFLRENSSKIEWFPQTADIKFDPKVDWIMFNSPEGYYRISYDALMLTRLSKQLDTNSNQLSPMMKALLINDEFHLANLGIVGYDKVLPLINYIANETDFEPWYLFDNYIKTIDKSIFNNTGLRNFMKNATSILFDKWNVSASPTYIPKDITRLTSFKLACYFEEVQCLNFSLREFNKWNENNGAFSPDIPVEVRPWIMYYGIKQNDSINVRMFEKLKSDFLADPVFSSTNSALMGLLGIETPVLFAKVLETIWLTSNASGDEIYSSLILMFSTSPWTLKESWKWIESHCDGTKKSSEELCGRLLTEDVISTMICWRSSAIFNDISAFLQRYYADLLTKLDITCTRRLSWTQTNSAVIEKYFNSRIF